MSTFWDSLSPAEKESCFEALRKPGRQVGSKKCWEIKGALLLQWNAHVLPKLIEISNYKNVRAIIFKGRHDLSTPIVWSCYLMGKKPKCKSLRPTIVAMAENESIARNAAQYFQHLKEGSFHAMLRDFDLSHAALKVYLCADHNLSNQETSDSYDPRSGDEGRKRSLCGSRISISPLNDQVAQEKVYATIGGTLIIEEHYYALTTAHGFANYHEESQGGEKLTAPPPDALEDKNSQRKDPEVISCVVSVSADCETELDDAQVDPESGDELRTALVVNDAIFPDLPQDLVTHGLNPGVICNRQSNWALVPVTNKRFQTGNHVELPGGVSVTLNCFADSVPQNKVIVASGVSGIYTTRFDQSASAILLPNSDKMQLVWSFQEESYPGDCGSWVIDNTGKAYGMVVATESRTRKTFCVPLSTIADEIGRNFGGVTSQMMSSDSPNHDAVRAPPAPEANGHLPNSLDILQDEPRGYDLNQKSKLPVDMEDDQASRSVTESHQTNEKQPYGEQKDSSELLDPTIDGSTGAMSPESDSIANNLIDQRFERRLRSLLWEQDIAISRRLIKAHQEKNQEFLSSSLELRAKLHREGAMKATAEASDQVTTIIEGLRLEKNGRFENNVMDILAEARIDKAICDRVLEDHHTMEDCKANLPARVHLPLSRSYFAVEKDALDGSSEDSDLSPVVIAGPPQHSEHKRGRNRAVSPLRGQKPRMTAERKEEREPHKPKVKRKTKSNQNIFERLQQDLEDEMRERQVKALQLWDQPLPSRNKGKAPAQGGTLEDYIPGSEHAQPDLEVTSDWDALRDPIHNWPLFDRDGRPLEQNGHVFPHSRLPPGIPQETPLGARKKEAKSERRVKVTDFDDTQSIILDFGDKEFDGEKANTKADESWNLKRVEEDIREIKKLLRRSEAESEPRLSKGDSKSRFGTHEHDHRVLVEGTPISLNDREHVYFAKLRDTRRDTRRDGDLDQRESVVPPRASDWEAGSPKSLSHIFADTQ